MIFILFLFSTVFSHLNFCVLPNRYEHSLQMAELAASEWNVYALDTIHIGLCEHHVRFDTHDSINTIQFSSEGNAPGLTRTRHRDGIPIEMDISINADWLFSNGNVYNVLLHEFGHVHGIKHDNSAEVMGYRLKLDTKTNQFVQDPFLRLSPQDIGHLKTNQTNVPNMNPLDAFV